MSDVRNGALATLIPFGLLFLFWELKIRKNHWFRASRKGPVNFKKIASVAVPVLMILWLVIGIILTSKYASERRDLRELVSENMKYFVAVPMTNSVPIAVSKDMAQKAADSIKYSRLNKTIEDIKRSNYESTEYDTFWSELQLAYGSTAVILPTVLIGLPGFPGLPGIPGIP